MNLRPTILFTAFLGLQAVGAGTITVTNTADSGLGTLRAALLTANDGDTVGFGLPTPAKITLTSGELVVSSGVSILGPGPSNLLVDGAHQSRIFHVVASNSAVTISGLSITNGFTQQPGGGLDNRAAILTVSNCVMAGNEAGQGGAIFNAGQLDLISSTMKDNTAASGGGLLNSKGTVLITNCTFTGNSSSFSGGAIDNEIEFGSTGTVRIVRSILSNNAALRGGGIANIAQGGTAILELVQSAVRSNTVYPNWFGVGSGGGVANGAGADSPESRANAAIIDSTIDGNVASEGGGIHTYVTDGLTVVGITNSTISGNVVFCVPPDECSPYGAGIYTTAVLHAGTGTVYVVHSTLAGNISQDYGDGIYGEATVPLGSSARVVIGSSMFAGSRTNGTMLTSGGAVFSSLGYNLCRDSGSGFLTHAADQINTDPRLGPLQDNGGPTFTHALLPGSPAIDKGRNFSGRTSDQRGLARTVNIAGIPNAVAGDGTDIGAVESQDARLRLVKSGVVSNRFGFNLIGPFNSVVVEASTTLSNWTALATNTLSDAALRFEYPSPEPSHLFYRARLYSP